MIVFTPRHDPKEEMPIDDYNILQNELNGAKTYFEGNFLKLN